MFFSNSAIKFLVVNMAIVFLGTSAMASGLSEGFCGNCPVNTVNCPLSCANCRRDTLLSDFLELESTCCIACPEEKGQAPAVLLNSRFEYSEQAGLLKIRYFEPAATHLTYQSHHPEGIFLPHSFGDALVLVNCAFLI